MSVGGWSTLRMLGGGITKGKIGSALVGASIDAGVGFLLIQQQLNAMGHDVSFGEVMGLAKDHPLEFSNFLAAEGMLPPARHSHTACVSSDQSQILIYGGIDSAYKVLQDLWAFSPEQ